MEAHDSRPNKSQIAYAFALRNCRTGWTPELRKQYFSWFASTAAWKGGNSFRGFLNNARAEAMALFVPENERAELEALSTKNAAPVVANYVAPKGPGKVYTLDEAVALAQGGLKKRNFDNGKTMFSSLMCITCHRFNGDGGSIGPDITGAANRYTMRDFLENIIDPSKVISDQYGSIQIEKNDGSVVIGRTAGEENGNVMVMTNPMQPNALTAVKASDIKVKKDYPVSMMPPGLINSLNQDELLDLIAYVMSGGDPKGKAFK
jgi:putative heme-binding domain-containing protein